jgi:hypothetical protein
LVKSSATDYATQWVDIGYPGPAGGGGGGGGGTPTWNINVAGNAATATTLATPRTINGVSFNGSANITVADSTKLPLGGGTLTGALAVGGDLTATGIIYTRAANNVMAVNDSSANLEIRNVVSATGDSGMAMMRFHCQGTYGIKMGLRADGYFGIGGWSRSAWSWYTAPNGDMIAAGNVIAYSDERLKVDWRALPDDFISRLAEVRHGAYRRTDTGSEQVGVSAQSLRPLMPEAVIESVDGYLSVAYGNAALVSAVELAKRVIQLEARLKELELKAA